MVITLDNPSPAAIKYPHILEGIRSINSSSDEAARMAGRGSIIFGVIYLLPAYFLAKNPFTFLFIVLSGIIIGNSIGFTVWLVKNNVKEAVSVVKGGCVIGGLIGYIVPHLLGDPSAWITGILGLIIGHRVGFALWYAKSNPYEEVTKAKLLQRGCLKDKKEKLTIEAPKVEKTLYETYSNDKYGFSIKYPNRWKLRPYPKTNVAGLPVHDVVAVAINGPDGAQINVIVGPTYGYSKTVEATEKYADEYIQRQNVEKINSRKITIDGIPSYQITYIRKFMIFKMAIKKTSIVREGYEYVITCRAPYKYFLKYELIFDECIQSFKFKRYERNSIIRKNDKEVKSQWDPAYG